MSNPTVLFDEDFQTWEAFKHKENFRWLFNKLEVALRQGLHAGPAGTAPQHSGLYISRPVYNPYGMGIGAKKFAYDADKDYEDFTNHAVVPPGHFWCEWLPGPQYTIDYQVKPDYRTWEAQSILVGEHHDDSNLTKFKQWTKLDPNEAPNVYTLPIKLPWFGVGAQVWDREAVPGFNIEMRRGKIIEIHLRHGNDPFDDLPVGTTITPVWHGEEVPDGVEFKENLFEDMTKYSASGNLSIVRKGYIINRPAP